MAIQKFWRFFIIMAFLAICLPGAAQAISITGPANITQSYTGTYTAQNTLAAGHTWTFRDSQGNDQGIISPDPGDPNRVIWQAPAIDDNGNEPIDITARVTELALPPGTATFQIKVYRTPKIINKESIPEVLQPGESTTNEHGSYLIQSSGGFIGPYAPNTNPNDKPFWEFIGPAYPAGISGGQLTVTTFTAPSQGVFAGSYTITVQSWVRDTGTGTGMVQGNDSISILVPTAIQKGPVRVMESRNTGSAGAIDYTIVGMPDNITYTMRLMDGLGNNAVDVTGHPDFGTVVPQAGPSNAGVYSFTYTPPNTASQTRAFYIVAEPDDQTSDPRWGEIYRPAPHGPMMVRRTSCVSGTLVDRNTRQAIAGATVSLIEPHTHIRSVVTDGQGHFSFNALPLNNRYEFWAQAPGYRSAVFSQAQAFLNTDLCDPARAVIAMAPIQNNAFISGAISDVNGNPIGADEAVTVTLVHAWADAGEPRMDFLGEVRTAGGNYYLGLETVPQNAPNPGVHDYYLIAYRPGFWVAQALPPGGFPYPNTNLQLTSQFDLTNYGLENIPPAVPKNFLLTPSQNAVTVPLTGGFSLRAIAPGPNNVGTQPAGFYDRLSASIAVEKLTQPQPGAEIWNDAKANPEKFEDREEYSKYTPTIMYMDVLDIQSSTNDELFTKNRGARVTIPIDLTVVNVNDLESEKHWVYTYQSKKLDAIWVCNAEQVPPKDIISIDYLGDGLVGWVTYLVHRGSWFGVGVPCRDKHTDIEGFKYPEFERYEIFGCFIRQLILKNSPQ
ncbi:MAG: carboxypeptidase regulatory-like domain-containing protein [Desulfatibacillaceae bacterium]|nr:carboxypeptidase regulatory-like domain-containing protein [Desulfatibacillaceae bacterium]